MDPTLAALVGAAIGSASTVVAAFVTPVLTSRRAHKARRREVMREVYAEGIRVLSDFAHCQSIGELRSIRLRMFEAQIQIQLVGSRRAGHQFGKLARAVDAWIDAIKEEASMQGWNSGDPLPVGELPESMMAYHDFVSLARRDIGMLDPVYLRLRRPSRNAVSGADEPSPGAS